jgi:hypothetical protein
LDHVAVIAGLIGWAALGVYAEKIEEAELRGTLTSYRQQQKEASTSWRQKSGEEKDLNWSNVSRQGPLE